MIENFYMSNESHFIPISSSARNDTITPEAKGEIETFPTSFDQSYIQLQRSTPLDCDALRHWETNMIGIQDTQCYIQKYTQTIRSDGYDPASDRNVRAINTEVSVKRYGIDPESAEAIGGTYNGTTVLHPTEHHLFSHALRYLNEDHHVVMVDMYAKDEYGYIRRDPNTALPETHTVTLFTDRHNNIVLLDPSNTTFTEYLQPLLQQLSSQQSGRRVITANVPGNKVYQVSNEDARRDCISVALAAANEIMADPHIEVSEVVRRIANVPKAIVPELSKKEAQAATQAIKALAQPLARGQHSTDPTIRKHSSEEIRHTVESMRKSPAFPEDSPNSARGTISHATNQQSQIVGRK